MTGRLTDEDPWTAAMMRGDFAAAWQVCDRVLAQRTASQDSCSDWPRHRQYVWRGAQLAQRRVLVRCYHGLGDTLQFIRFAQPLRRIAREVTVWVQPPLLNLVATAPGVDRVSALHDGLPEFLFDVDIEIMELPHALRVSMESLSGHVPYLFPRMRSRVPAQRDDVLKIGLAWQSGNWTQERSIPLDTLQRLQSLPGVALYSLQFPPEAHALEVLGAADLACKEIELLASRMQRLDLIISADTYTAHLAGALGLPVWTLLPTTSDWRWMHDRTDSPWYPTMRLFRQSEPGDWDDVMGEVMQALRQLTLYKNRALLHPEGRIQI
jgi:hypothetical protein